MLIQRHTDVITPTYQGAFMKAQVLTGAGAYNTDAIDVSSFIELLLFINLTAESGTTPTLDCKLQYSPDNTNWVDSGDSFTQMNTTTGVFLKKASAIFGKYVRLVFTLGGTTPSYTITPTIIAKQ